MRIGKLLLFSDTHTHILSSFLPLSLGLNQSVKLSQALWDKSLILDTTRSIQFNIVSKGLKSERMSFWLNEAANDIRDLLLPTLEGPKAKL